MKLYFMLYNDFMIRLLNGIIKSYLQNKLETQELDELDYFFDVPTKEASKKFDRNTISIYLADVRENLSLRQNRWENSFTNAGQLNKTSPAIMMDNYFIISVFSKTKDVETEHNLFSKLLYALYNPSFTSYLNEQAPIPLMREISCELFPQKYIDEHLGLQLWNAIDQNVRPIISLKITAQLNTSTSNSMTPVRTKEIKYTKPYTKVYNITGKVISKNDHNDFPVQATIELINQGGETIQKVQSNIHGIFTLNEVDEESQTVDIIAPGYQKTTIVIEDIQVQSGKQLIITLNKI